MQVLKKIISQEEIDQIFKVLDEEGIAIGELTDFDPEKVKNLFNLLASRLDKIIALDKDVNGIPTWISQQALTWRGFTYDEFGALFNTRIDESEFPYYPVFSQVRKSKGGITFEKQRQSLLAKYNFDDESYIQLLCDGGYRNVLTFFFGTWAKLSALLPRKKLHMHTYIVAPTGSGKSELMRVLFYRMQKKFKKYSLVILDPHGDLAEKIKRSKLNALDPDRVVYLEPYFKEGYTFTINPFEIKTRTTKNINYQGEQIISILEEALNRDGSNLSHPMVSMLEKAVYFLLNREGSYLEDLVSLLGGDETLTKEAFEYDSSFDKEFLRPTNKTRTALKGRIESFLNSSVLKNLLSGSSTVDLEELLNSSKIIIINLDGMPEFSQITMGKILIARIRSILRKRPKDGKLHTIMCIDECQNFATSSYDRVLSEMRKYGLHYILANQYVEQLGKQAKAVKKNTAIKICASDDMDDIKEMIKLPKDASLKDYEFYLKTSGKSLVKFKSPSILLRNKKKYELTKKEEEKLDELMLSRYYKVIGTPKYTKRTKKPNVQGFDLDISDVRTEGLPIPPFKLLINEND